MSGAQVTGALQDLLLGKVGVDPTSFRHEAIVGGSPRRGGSSAAIADMRPALVGSQAGEGGAIVETGSAAGSIHPLGGIVAA